MATQSQFLKLLQDIEPSPTTKSNASSAHNNLRSFLRDHENFKAVHLETFLSGSYKRDTAIRPRTKNGNTDRPDVDIIVVVDYGLDDSPAEVLNFLFTTIKVDYEEKYDTVRRQTRSVGLETGLADMDVVPIIAPYGKDSTLYIPDRKLEKWLITNPPQHTEWTTQMNRKSDGRFKPLVKLVKWWRRENPTISKRPKGFVIECIVADCMDLEETQYEELFLKTFEEIVRRYEIDIILERVPLISDPGVPGQYVTTGMTFDAFKGFYNKVKTHAELGRTAQQEKNPEIALSLWKKIFGRRFPSGGGGNQNSLLRSAVNVQATDFPNYPITPNKKPRGFA